MHFEGNFLYREFNFQSLLFYAVIPQNGSLIGKKAHKVCGYLIKHKNVHNSIWGPLIIRKITLLTQLLKFQEIKWSYFFIGGPMTNI